MNEDFLRFIADMMALELMQTPDGEVAGLLLDVIMVSHYGCCVNGHWQCSAAVRG